MLLRAVLDIDPNDLRMRELGELAFRYGLFDMTEVLLAALEAMQQDGEKVMMIVNETTSLKVIQTFIACSVLGFASWKHEHFEIEIPIACLQTEGISDKRVIRQFHRNYPPEVHRAAGERYWSQATEIIIGYGQAVNESNPAE